MIKQMTRMSSTFTLEDMRRAMGWNPWHFWGFVHATKAPLPGNCSDLVFEYGYQHGDMAGRQDIRTAIEFVLEQLTNALKYPVGPSWVEEDLAHPQYITSAMRPTRQMTPGGSWLSVHTAFSKIRAVGYRRLTFLTDAAPELKDNDGDELTEEFTLNFAVAEGITASQIALFFDPSDVPAGEDPTSERYRIAPLSVSITDGVCSIRGNSWLLGKPTLYEYSMTGKGLDPTAASSFASTLKVYRDWLDPDGTDLSTAQSVIEWEGVPAFIQGFCCGTTADAAGRGSVIARAGIRDPDTAAIYFGASAYNSSENTWSNVVWTGCRPPDRVIVRYLAGIDLDPAWRRVIADYVMAELPRRLCACDTANKVLHTMQFDLARTDGAAGETYAQIDPQQLANPFGTRRGQVKAWLFVGDRAHTGFVRV